jgi:hypothetical protein
VLAVLATPHLAHQVAHQGFGSFAVQGGDRVPGGLLQGQGLVLGQIGQPLQRGEPGPGDAGGAGILVQQREHPAGAEVVGQSGEFGKDPG